VEGDEAKHAADHEEKTGDGESLHIAP